jgi:glycosyltransferase involved in cell wall biosynthesis
VTAAPDVTAPGVSYVLTVYNKRPFLPAVIAGLAAQRGDFAREFIFVDDGSTDGSGEEVARLTAGWPHVRIVRQSNHGLSHATNRGMKEARLAHIKLVDADDVLVPEATQILLDGLRRQPGAVLAYGNAATYATADEAFARLGAPAAGDAGSCRADPAPLAFLVEHHAPQPSRCLYSTEAVRTVGGCDPEVFIQDLSLALRLAAMGAFVATDAVVVLCPRIAPGRVNDDGPQCLHDANLALANFLERRDLAPGLVRAAVRRATGRAYLWARRREGAGLLSYWTWLRLRGLLAPASLGARLVRDSCGAFTLSRPVRPGSP